MTELDTITRVQRVQIDKNLDHENASVKEVYMHIWISVVLLVTKVSVYVLKVQDKLDKVEYELSRRDGKCDELESRRDSDVQRIIVLEKEVAASQDTIFRRDRSIKEERHRSDATLQVIQLTIYMLLFLVWMSIFVA